MIFCPAKEPYLSSKYNIIESTIQVTTEENIKVDTQIFFKNTMTQVQYPRWQNHILQIDIH